MKKSNRLKHAAILSEYHILGKLNQYDMKVAVSQAMQEYADQSTQELKEENEQLKGDIKLLKWDVNKLTADLRQSEKEVIVYIEERDSAHCERNEARECEELWLNKYESLQSVVDRMAKQIKEMEPLAHEGLPDNCLNNWDEVKFCDIRNGDGGQCKRCSNFKSE